MTEVPKIVPKILYDRLRAAQPERALPGQTLPAHPDADLLTAFAEQALAAPERDRMLEHLSLCADCRDVVALALPQADVVPVSTAADAEAVQAPPTSPWNWLRLPILAWPSLRWAALAAGVVVAASILLLHPGNPNRPMPLSADRQVAPAALSAAGGQIASPAVASLPSQPPSVLAKNNEAPLKPELQMSKKRKAGRAAPLQVDSGMLLAENKGSAQAGELAATPSGAAAFNAARTFNNDAPTSQGANETVEVSGAALAIETQSSNVNSLIAQNDAAPIEKAKPALQQEEVISPQKSPSSVGALPAKRQGANMMSTVGLAPAPSRTLAQTVAQNVTWTIAGGVLQRSLDSGQSWQNTLRADHPLLCYAPHNVDVWAGGQAGTLFHSSDNGITWLRVQPSVKSQTLSADVTRIDIRDNTRENAGGPLQIVVSTSNNETWSSVDGGKTWEKK
jgi:hypothetical protein